MRSIRDPALFEREQERIFRGETWSYLLLEAEIPNSPAISGRLMSATRRLIVNSRTNEGAIHAFVNRCAHRAPRSVRETPGNDSTHALVAANFHQLVLTTYRGNLMVVPFMRGVKGKAGVCRAIFDKSQHGLEETPGRKRFRAFRLRHVFVTRSTPCGVPGRADREPHIDRTFTQADPDPRLSAGRRCTEYLEALLRTTLRDPNHGGCCTCSRFHLRQLRG